MSKEMEPSQERNSVESVLNRINQRISELSGIVSEYVNKKEDGRFLEASGGLDELRKVRLLLEKISR